LVGHHLSIKYHIKHVYHIGHNKTSLCLVWAFGQNLY
jgi:hypothetical protein